MSWHPFRVREDWRTPGSGGVAALAHRLQAFIPSGWSGGEEVTHRSPKKIMEEIAALDAESAEVLENIKALLK